MLSFLWYYPHFPMAVAALHSGSLGQKNSFPVMFYLCSPASPSIDAQAQTYKNGRFTQCHPFSRVLTFLQNMPFSAFQLLSFSSVCMSLLCYISPFLSAWRGLAEFWSCILKADFPSRAIIWRHMILSLPHPKTFYIWGMVLSQVSISHTSVIYISLPLILPL